MTVHPATRAGAHFWAKHASAKLYAVNAATTPTGSWTTGLLPANGMMLPPLIERVAGSRHGSVDIGW
jgi:hypothetical protein